MSPNNTRLLRWPAFAGVFLTVFFLNAAVYAMPVHFVDSTTGRDLLPEQVVITRDGEKFTFSKSEKVIRLEQGYYTINARPAGYRHFSAHLKIDGDSLPVRFHLDRLETPPELRSERIEQLRRPSATLVLGYVMDDETGDPIPGVKVETPGITKESVTDAAGFFEISVPLRPGNSGGSVGFSKMGYQTEERDNIELWPNGDWTIQVRLSKGAGKKVVLERESVRKMPSIIQAQKPSHPEKESTLTTSENQLLALQSKEAPISSLSGSPTNTTVRIPTNIRVLQTNGTTIDYISMETYVRRSLVREWIASWSTYAGGSNSLKAGAIAVRTYAIGYVHTPYASNYDICASTTCQVYNTTVSSSTDAAVTNTTGYVMVNSTGGIPRGLTEYSAENNQLGLSCGDGFTAPTGSCLSDPVCTGESEYGHGRGMCQWGTAKWATGLKFLDNSFTNNVTLTNGFAKQDWIWIAEHYFPTLRLVKGYPLVIGDDVRADGSVGVHLCTPSNGIENGTNCPVIATKTSGSTGIIIDGPILVTSDGFGYTWWKIQWSDSTVGWSIEGNIQRDIPAPTAPSGLSVNVISSSQINLGWTDNSNNEIGFNIERGPSSGGPWTQINTLSSNVTTYSDTTLDPGTTYYFRVGAYNLEDDVSYSNTANGTTPGLPPVLAAISNRTVNEGSLLTFTNSATAADFVDQVTDFETFASGTANGTVLFRDPRFSGSTSTMLDASPNISSVTNGFPANANAGSRVLKASWSFATGTTNPWLRLTTGGVTSLPSPVIDFTRRFRFEIYTDKDLKVGLGLRETTNAVGTPIGSNGGSAGTAIEWVGVPAKTGSAPNPSRTVTAGIWTQLSFNLPSEPTTNFSGGNSILSTASGLGVLEHLALVPAAGTGAYNIYLDNFEVFTPKTLTYSLDPGAPAGASVNPTTGVFSWTPSAGQGAAVYNITVRVTDNGTPNQSDTKTFSVTVTAPPVVTSPPANLTANAGSTAKFSINVTGSQPITFRWKKAGNNLSNGGNVSGATSASLTISGISQTDAASYSVGVTNSVGSTNSASATLTVIDPPSITLSPDSQSIGAGSNAIFAVTATGGNLFYTWKKGISVIGNGGNISGATSPSLTVSGISQTDAGSYSVVITNTAGSVTSAPPAVLTVIDPPAILTQPSSRTNNVGSVATFTASASGTTPLNYQWKKNGTNLINAGTISGATSATLTLDNVSAGDADNYAVAVTNAAGTANSSSVTLTVINVPTIASEPQSQTNNPGESVLLSVVANGDAPLTFQWRKDGSPLTDSGNISGAATADLLITNIVSTNAGGYSVVVSNSAGSATSIVATLTVRIPPTITNQPASQTVDVGSSATFTVAASGTSPFAYQWYFTNAVIAGATSSSYTRSNVQTNDAGNYSVVVSNAAGVHLSSNAVLIVTLPSDTVPPVVKFLGPGYGKGTNLAVVSLTGTASDPVSLASVSIVRSVKYVLNSGGTNNATLLPGAKAGETNWTTGPITLVPGTNTLKVMAYDDASNEGKIGTTFATSVFFYNTTNNIVIDIVDGSGGTNGNVYGLAPFSKTQLGLTGITNGQILPVSIGRPYTLNAFIGAGTNYVFTNWGVGASSVAATNWTKVSKVSFITQSNMVISANFITNPFTPVAGLYNGLFSETTGPKFNSAGAVTGLKVTEKSLYTGKLYVDGDSFSFGGKFNPSGEGTATAIRTNKFGKENLSVFVKLNWNTTNETITGTVSNSAWSAELLAYKASFDTNNNPSTVFNGTYTLLIPRTNYPPAPAGIGYGFVTNYASGLVALTGSLADGEKVTQKTTVAKNGKWPLFAQTHKSKATTYTNSYLANLITNKSEYLGTVFGWITFTHKTNAPTGTVTVTKTPIHTYNLMQYPINGILYTAGYTNTVDILASPYVIPAGAGLVINPTLPTIAFDDGATTFLETNLTILASNKVVVSATLQTNKINVKLTAKTGLLSGDFLYPSNVLNPTNMVKSTFLGSVLQNTTNAAGFYLRGTNAVGGAVILEGQ